MDRQLQEFYEQQFDLFLHPGWKAFMEDLEKVLKPLEEIMTVPDAQTLHRRQGQIDILRWVLNRKEMLQAAWQDLQASEEADSA
jgi:hypothetical protein